MRTVLTVDGMTCPNCVRTLTRALEEVSGVSRADVSLETFAATVEHAPEATVARLISTIEEEGYSATAG
ncbi:MAG: heavy-metal-associated domain-containing protein [Acidobacteriota bacterium]